MTGRLWLIGMMGAGKSRVGLALAHRLGLPLVDTDADVEARTGCSVAQLWGERGEAAFRAMERVAVERAADGPLAVVATGGGVILDEDNVAAMRRSGTVVWLDAAAATLATRLAGNSSRPLLQTDASEEALAEILEQRRELYRSAADLVVSTDAVGVEDVAERIEAAWRES